MKETADIQPYTTRDGSETLWSPHFDEHYHSVHGAVQESLHVFLKMGWDAVPREDSIHIFEMGFGTGLNALLTWARASERKVHYTSVEAFPLTASQLSSLNFCAQTEIPDCANKFSALHAAEWGEETALDAQFTLHKQAIRIEDFSPSKGFDLVYWDAFAPTSQPELWTEELFATIYGWMNEGGVWVTYSAKGAVRRALQAVGFTVERLPGPPGKREMLRATK